MRCCDFIVVERRKQYRQTVCRQYRTDRAGAPAEYRIRCWRIGIDWRIDDHSRAMHLTEPDRLLRQVAGLEKAPAVFRDAGACVADMRAKVQ
jgi:hypothetical protein